MKLSDFADKSSMNFFRILNLKTNFLKVDPSQWGRNEEYKEASAAIKSISSTNDPAERAIQLCTKIYGAKKTTKAEEFNKICVNTHFYNQNK